MCLQRVPTSEEWAITYTSGTCNIVHSPTIMMSIENNWHVTVLTHSDKNPTELSNEVCTAPTFMDGFYTM